jgi:putative membrane protein
MNRHRPIVQRLSLGLKPASTAAQRSRQHIQDLVGKKATMRKRLTIAFAASFLVALPASGQNPVREGRQIREQPGAQIQKQNPNQTREQSRTLPTQKRGKAAVNDALFALAAGEALQAELALSELGAQRATDPELKRFSQRMIEEHGNLNQELRTLAGEKRLNLPTQIGYCAQFCHQSLAGLSGEEFDRCYAKAQYLAHMEACALFEAEAERGADRDITAFASKGLAHIKEHLRNIKPIAKKYMHEEDESEGTRETKAPRTEP